ncbi:hypothetical protein AQJ66_00185 [Streptomyces bungoensis]|uniref:PE-PGRS family protein n=1 Tax=Streptomyces bungoensis TaxID=285568 RepID=A0A101TDF6_9ACTN|nr:DUF6585 family protein [Streptomyces bungoensis]KUN90279.1 hypothetical protein AQJ66_00185 [Streptomyces bungoensis]
MNAGAAGGRDEELLLARISAAAGRARLGRRRVTYRAPRTAPGARWAATAGAWLLPRTGGGPAARAGARLDLYEYGMTAAVGKRIHVVRFDTTVVRRRWVLSARGVTRALVLVDVDGDRTLLRCGAFGRPARWWPEIRRAVTDAQAPRALAALRLGARLDFGPLWITRDEVGSGRTALRWAQVERIESRNGSVVVRATGRWQVWATGASGIPNLCVFQALAEQLAGAERDED